MMDTASATFTSVVFSPLVPWPVLAGLVAFAVIVWALAAWRRARGLVWRLAALATLALLIANPTLVREERQPIPDVAVVVVDDSPSQGIDGRAERAEKALARLRAELEGRPDLELRVERASTDGDQGLDETHLFDAWRRATADLPRQRLAGTFLITDGQVHDVPRDTATLSGVGPFHLLLTGRRGEADRRLTVVNAPSFGLVGKSVELTIRVDDLAPKTRGGDATMTMRMNGGPPQRYRVPVGRDARLEFPVDHGGQNVLEVTVDPLPGELTTANNRAAVVVNGVRDRLKVLLISGEPHAGERTWRNLLKADPSVDLVHFTILRPPEKQDGTPIRELSLIAFPIRELFEIKLEEFDLIIFDRYRRQGVLPQLYLENIARYVENGGALLECSGAGLATPLSLYRAGLGPILPAEPTGRLLSQPFKPRVTELGLRHPVTAGLTGAGEPDGDPQWGRWFHQVDVAPKEGAVVMSGIDDKPLLILDRVGQGRVAQLASDQIWLWSRGYDGGGPQAELLRRLAHWLMREPELEEEDLRARVDGRRITVERRSLKPDVPPVTMTTPDGTTRPLPMTADGPGRWTATVTADGPGIHAFSDGVLTAVAVTGAMNPPELADVRATPDRLAPVVEATGGGVVWLSDDEDDDRYGGFGLRRTDPERVQSGAGWLGLRANDNHVVTGLTRIPALPIALALGLALVTLLAAWRREGR